MTSPFGCFVVGEAPLPFQQIDETRFTCALHHMEKVNHIAVYLERQVALPDDHVAQLFLQLPLTTEFLVLGTLSNTKKSAMFKLSSLKQVAGQSFQTEMVVDNAVATLGIQVVSAALLDEVQMNMDPEEAATHMQVARIARPAQNAEEKINAAFDHLLQHVASYAITIDNEEYVPFKQLLAWRDKKLKLTLL